MIWFEIVGLMILSGVLGRTGGAKGYHTLFRDWGCPAVVVLAVKVALGWHPAFWWAYLAIFLLHWGAFSTYWDWLFKGEDNLWFSGFMVGLSIAPVWFLDHSLWWIVPVRAVALCLIWGGLNKYLPQRRMLFWERAVVEDNLRYQASL